MQEYLDTSGTSIKPATYLEDGAWELVPAGAVLPTHVYEPDTGWREVDPDKAIFNGDEVSTNTWFEIEGPKDTIFDFKMPIRITTNLPTLRSFEYTPAVQEYTMIYWLHMSHLAHTYQNRDSGKTVDFETFVQMVKNGDPNAQIYVYKYDLNPDGTRGNLRQQMVDPSKGLTIQLINDGVLEYSPLATVVNPKNAQAKNAFIFSATDAGQIAIAVNAHTDLINMNNREVREGQLMNDLLSYPFMAMDYVALYATSFQMKNPDANTPHFTLPGKDVRSAVNDIIKFFREQLNIDLVRLELPDLISISFD
ncbi:MAG: hypothetical protein LC131_11825 [Anaerolineae bacterium]|nr:hypothetical protein [Anaerolineae bacterium]